VPLPSRVRCRTVLRVTILLVVSAGGFAVGQTQQTQPASRITSPINEQNRVTLAGNVHPLAQAQYDRGAVPDSFPVQRTLLMLRRSPQEEAALQDFLVQTHTLGNAQYHKWLKPEQFGALYGPSDQDIAVVSGWLGKHGLAVARVTKGKTAIEFSGTAGQLRTAFNTEIHIYVMDGQEHYANDRDPQIPAVLAPVVAGITPLNNFVPQPQIRALGEAAYDPKTHLFRPQWTTYYPPPLLALAPGDFAVQYDLNPLYAAGIDGTGVAIGIIGASNVDPTNFTNYRSFFGLPAGTLNAIIDGLDPGPSPARPYGNWAETESVLDVEIPSGVAPGATIDLYTAADTTVQSGLLLAAQRAVDDDQAPVLSLSYGECEQGLGASGNQFWATLWEQAAAQGQTVLVSAGDNGSAGCDDFDIPQPAQYGLAVNGFASTPWNIAVGGTDFFYNSYNGTTTAQDTELATYWNLTPDAGTPTTSLLRPAPEQPWNDPFGLDLYDGGVYDPSENGASIVAGSGGASTIYDKPAWQSGKGVPSDRARDLPDLSLFAADFENDSTYPVCLGSQECNPSLGTILVSAIGGTSASAPAMAGIMALINQKYGRQGQANFVLYPLAAQQPEVFHDVTKGSNDVPCTASSTCTPSTVNDNTKGFYTLGHYYSTPGYDQASGLGSVDASLLLQYWNSLTFAASSTSLNVSETTFTHGTPVDVSVQVTGSGGTPSGDIGLISSESPTAADISLPQLTLASGSASATLNDLPGGQYQLTARYTGDTLFASSSSSPVMLNVAPENSTLSLSGSYWNNGSNSFQPITAGGSYPFGTYIVLDAQPVGVNAPQGGSDGTPSGSVTFADAGAGGTESSGAVNLNVKGISEWPVSPVFPVGSNSVSASYSGDASFHASTTQTPLSITVTKALTGTWLYAQPRDIAVGSPTTLNWEIFAPFSGPDCADEGACTFYFQFVAPPTGTATFSFGNTVLGTAPVVANTGASAYAWATLNVGDLPLGTDAITATYPGDANYGPATATFNVIVGQAASLTGSANPPSIDQAEFTQITANVAGVAGMPTPTGSVSFAAPAGSVNFWTDTEPLKNGTAISIGLPGEDFFGNVPVDVSYSGDSVYGPADTTVYFAVTKGTSLPFSLSGTSVVITPGATAGNSSTISVTPNGFTGAVYLSCALTSSPAGAANRPTCSIPASVNITGTTAVTATMTVNSTAPSSGAVVPRLQIWPLADEQGTRAAETAAIVLAAFSLMVFLTTRRSRWRVAAALCVIAAFGALASCGGGTNNGGGGSGGGNPPIGGTTPGQYVFTVQGALSAGGVSENQTTVTVTVQ